MELDAQDYIDALTSQRNEALTAAAQLNAVVTKLTRQRDAATRRVAELEAMSAKSEEAI